MTNVGIRVEKDPIDKIPSSYWNNLENDVSLSQKQKSKVHNKNKHPQFRIDLELIKTKGWSKFIRLASCATYWFLVAWIIRAKVDTGGFRLYEDFYCKNMLVSRYSQEDIAKYLEIKQGTVSKHITELEVMGLIVKHTKVIYNKTCLIYQLGIRHGDGCEELFLERVLRKKAIEDMKNNSKIALKEYGITLD